MERVVFIGDSWGRYLGEAAETGNLLQPLNAVADWQRTTFIGSTASKFVRNYDSYMDLAVEAVKKPCRLIVFSLGGNDFYNLAHFNDLSAASESFIDESFTKIRNNLISVLKELRENTSAPILFSGYDYFNIDKLVDLFTPDSRLRKLETPLFNRLMMKEGRFAAEAAAAVSGVFCSVNWGLLQHNADPDRYPLRGGNPNEPTPVSWIPDGMHPTKEGYRLLLLSTLKQAGILPARNQ